jgi:peptidoglycan-associated lipoprotein
MVTRRIHVGYAALLLPFTAFLLAACHRTAPTPVVEAPRPQPAQSLVVLLPEPDGKPTGLSVTNSAGSQTLDQPYQAVHIERADSAPTAPFMMDQPEARRMFGDVLDALPLPEASFLLYFDENKDTLTPASQDRLPAILNTVRERHSTAISVVGHTDTLGDPQYNYGLGLRRAQAVADILRRQGANPSDLFIESHGDTDLYVKTGPGVAESLNRRVEVIVR